MKFAVELPDTREGKRGGISFHPVGANFGGRIGIRYTVKSRSRSAQSVSADARRAQNGRRTAYNASLRTE